MCQHNLPFSIVYAHCLLPGRAFASLYALLFLEKEAEIGGRGIRGFRTGNFDLLRYKILERQKTTTFRWLLLTRFCDLISAKLKTGFGKKVHI